MKTLIPVANYIESMRNQKDLAAGVKRVRFFLATDDTEAEAEIKAAFKPGQYISLESSIHTKLNSAIQHKDEFR